MDDGRCAGPHLVHGNSRPSIYDRPVGSLPVGREDVERAAGVIAGRLHRTPTLSCRTLGTERLSEGRAPPAHGLVQAARRPHEARFSHLRGEGPRRDRRLGRKPCGGARLRRSSRRDGRARRDVPGRKRGQSFGPPRHTARRSTSRRPGRETSSSGSPQLRGGDGAGARASVRRPARRRRPGNGRARDPRGRLRSRADRRALRWRRARLRDRGRRGGHRRRDRGSRARDLPRAARCARSRGGDSRRSPFGCGWV